MYDERAFAERTAHTFHELGSLTAIQNIISPRLTTHERRTLVYLRAHHAPHRGADFCALYWRAGQGY